MNASAQSLRRAFRYLKRGVFPPDSIDQFTFGRDVELRLIHAELRDVDAGANRHLFLEGTYGHGKSHVLKAIEAIALDLGFAVSWVTIDGYGHAFNHPTRYFHALLENLRIPNSGRRGLTAIVNQWLRGSEREAVVNWASQNATWLSWPVIHLSRSLTDDKRVDWDIGHWIEGRDLAGKSGRVHFETVSRRMQEVALLSRAAGLSGVVYLFDELETVATLLWGIRQRYLSYEFLNLLLDGRRRSHCFFGFAVTPDFGVRVAGDSQLIDYYQVDYPGGCRFIQKWRDSSLDVVRLKKLNRVDLIRLITSLRNAHGSAYPRADHSKFTTTFIRHLVDNAERNNLGVRDIVRSAVQLFEVAEQHPSANVAAAYRAAHSSGIR